MNKKKIIIISMIIICLIGAIGIYFWISKNNEEKGDKINIYDNLKTPVSSYHHPTVPEGLKK